MKKIILTTLLILIFILTIGMTKTLAADPTSEEAIELLNKIPDEISVDLKEIEWEQVLDVLEPKIKQMMERDDINIDLIFGNNMFGTDANIKEVTICLYTSDLGDTGFGFIQKTIKINYSNSSYWNEEDAKYVEDFVKENNLYQIRYKILNLDGSSSDEYYEEKGDFSWDKEIKIDDNIKVYETEEFSNSTVLYLFKNDILYKKIYQSYDLLKIIIPEEIEETDEDYIKYVQDNATDNINGEEQHPFRDFVVVDTWTENGIEYKMEIKYKIEDRRYEDFLLFPVTVQYRLSANGVSIGQLDADNIINLSIAKEEEYRAKLNPILQNVEIKSEENNNYLKGTMEITELILGCKHSAIEPEYIPEIVLVDENNKEYKTVVTKTENDNYNFEIELNKEIIGKNYKILVKNTSPNNKYPENEIYATLEENVNIDVTKNDITIKSIDSKDNAKLSVKGPYILGDVNEDGKINTKDARLVLLNYVGKEELSETQELAADVNLDGKINTKDARQILLYYVGKITSF